MHYNLHTYARHRSSHKWRARRVSSFMLLPLSKSSCPPSPYLSLSTLICVHACIHMYACDHCDHTHPHNALYSLSTKHMSVYWTRYWSTFHCQHSTQEGRRLEDSTRLQQKGAQLSASHSHYEMCSRLCSTARGLCA